MFAPLTLKAGYTTYIAIAVLVVAVKVAAAEFRKPRIVSEVGMLRRRPEVPCSEICIRIGTVNPVYFRKARVYRILIFIHFAEFGYARHIPCGTGCPELGFVRLIVRIHPVEGGVVYGGIRRSYGVYGTYIIPVVTTVLITRKGRRSGSSASIYARRADDSFEFRAIARRFVFCPLQRTAFVQCDADRNTVCVRPADDRDGRVTRSQCKTVFID